MSSKKHLDENVIVKEQSHDSKTGGAVTLRVNCDRLNLRKGPATTADALYILKRDERLTLLEERNDWMKVQYPKQNLVGYVMTHLVVREE